MSKTNPSPNRARRKHVFIVLLCVAFIPSIAFLASSFSGKEANADDHDTRRFDDRPRTSRPVPTQPAMSNFLPASVSSGRPPISARTQRGLTPETETLRQRIQRMRPEDSDRKELVAELRSVLTNEFQVMHDRQAKEIEAAQKRLEKLQATHKLREERKEEIIDRRLAQLTGQPDVLDWIPQSVQRQPQQPGGTARLYQTDFAPNSSFVNRNSTTVVETITPNQYQPRHSPDRLGVLDPLVETQESRSPNYRRTDPESREERSDVRQP